MALTRLRARSSAAAACGPGSRWPARGCSSSPAQRSSPPPTRVVDHSLGSAPLRNQTNIRRPAASSRTCQTAKANGTLTPDPGPAAEAHSPSLQLGAAEQRTSDLHELLLWSLAGLGVATDRGRHPGVGDRTADPAPAPQGHRRRPASLARASRRAHQPRRTRRRAQRARRHLRRHADRLDLAFASQRRFVANASHELRTPLTSMRTLIDVAMAKPIRTTEQLEVLAGPRPGGPRPIRGAHRRAPDPGPIGPRPDHPRARRPRSSRPRRNRPGQHGRQRRRDRHRRRPVTQPRPSATGSCSSASSPTWSTTPSATTSPAAR